MDIRASYPANKPDRAYQLRHVASNIRSERGSVSQTEANICLAAADRLSALEKMLESIADDPRTDSFTADRVNAVLGRAYR